MQRQRQRQRQGRKEWKLVVFMKPPLSISKVPQSTIKIHYIEGKEKEVCGSEKGKAQKETVPNE